MHKLAFIAVGIFMMAGMHITFNAQGNLHETETRLAEDQFEILARNAALAGVDHVKQMLSESFTNYSQITGTNDGVSYAVDATMSGSEVTVRSMGLTYDAAGDPITFNVLAKFRQRTILPSLAPPFMRYAVVSEEDLILRGNVDGDIYVDGDSDNTLNANMHTNKNLQVNGNAALVKGFGTYHWTANPSEASIADSFEPNHNPNNAPTCYQTEEVVIPSLNPATLAASLTVDSTTAGDVVLTGAYDLGTREDPYIWHVQGDLTIQNGGTTVNGYVMFLVDGGADLRANVQVGNSGYAGGDESSIAFYTGTGVRLRGNTEVWAQIYSNGGMEFESGTPDLYGSVTTRGVVDFRGAVDIYYRKASPALTTPFQPNMFTLDRIAYSEW